jgi:hypothetical protein
MTNQLNGDDYTARDVLDKRCSPKGGTGPQQPPQPSVAEVSQQVCGAGQPGQPQNCDPAAANRRQRQHDDRRVGAAPRRAEEPEPGPVDADQRRHREEKRNAMSTRSSISA